MDSSIKLVRESEALMESLNELYFESHELFGPRKYQPDRIADTIYRCIKRTDRRREKMFRAITKELGK